MRRPRSLKVDPNPLATGTRPTVIHVPIESIFPDPLNPRIHSRQQIRAIARSFQAFGFNAPILVDKRGRIIVGHGRFEAARYLGLTHVPIIRLEHLSEQQAKAYMLADNKLSDRSSWDDHQLALRLKELQVMALDFEIEATGFELPEIDLRIQSLESSDATDAADEFDPLQGPAISKVGDLWILDKHRLLCGSALDRQAYDSLLGTDAVGMVITDPPYNIKIKQVAGKGRRKHREFPMASGEMSPMEFTEFLLSVLTELASRSVLGAVFFAFMDWRHMAEMINAIDRSGCEMINLCVWVKTNGGMGSLYRSAHELVFVFRHRGTQHRNNVLLGRYGRDRRNVWHHPGMNSFPRRGQERALDHPTIKPIGLIADAILDVSKHNDIVLDPFCGSGSTLLAAARTGRRGYGIELDPQYVDLAIARWQKLTNRPAIHASGKTFAEIAEERKGGNG